MITRFLVKQSDISGINYISADPRELENGFGKRIQSIWI
jgi:hypothetical protein